MWQISGESDADDYRREQATGDDDDDDDVNHIRRRYLHVFCCTYYMHNMCGSFVITSTSFIGFARFV